MVNSEIQKIEMTGKSFHWDDLSSPRLDFIECFVKEENEGGGGDKYCGIGADVIEVLAP
ncbi:unnamed protein product [Onchocerca flexuosa]|uniref:Uncharacterized protein n=1 Tax=Onchocerca flexuosa TaxID=387005 RepID=A0A183H7W4_9BILA|nr:unnamed protein product [Onchocerca flexuosa]